MALAVLHKHELHARLDGCRVLTSRKQACQGVPGPCGDATWLCTWPVLRLGWGRGWSVHVAPRLRRPQGSRAFIHPSASQPLLGVSTGEAGLLAGRLNPSRPLKPQSFRITQSPRGR